MPKEESHNWAENGLEWLAGHPQLLARIICKRDPDISEEENAKRTRFFTASSHPEECKCECCEEFPELRNQEEKENA